MSKEKREPCQTERGNHAETAEAEGSWFRQKGFALSLAFPAPEERFVLWNSLQGLALAERGGKSLGGFLKRGVGSSSSGSAGGFPSSTRPASPVRLTLSSAGPDHSNVVHAKGAPSKGNFKWFRATKGDYELVKEGGESFYQVGIRGA